MMMIRFTKGSLISFCVVYLGLLCLVAGDCSLSCKEKPCFASFQEVRDCLYSIPFSDEWRNSTLLTLISSLDSYGFRDLLKNTGPPYNIQYDILASLRALQSTNFEKDIDFQEAVQLVMQKPYDAHTRYSKPLCYDATFAQPFSFVIELAGHGEVVVKLGKNVVTAKYTAKDPLPFIGKRVKLIDGLETITAINTWTSAHVERSNDPSIRFNVGVRDFLYRSQRQYAVPASTSMTYTFEDGTTATFDWLGVYGPSLANNTICLAPKSETVNKNGESMLIDEKLTMKVFDSAYPVEKTLTESSTRKVIVPTTSNTSISCFVSTNDDGKTLVLKIGSFYPQDKPYIRAWTNFLGDVKTCLEADYDNIVVDVIQNGGGYVCLGLRVLTMLVEDFNKNHDLVQMNYDLLHSQIMDQYVSKINAPQPYFNPDEVELIMDPKTKKPFADGQAYYNVSRYVTQGGVSSQHTGVFWLDCTEAMDIFKDFKPKKFVPPEQLYVVTDGTCGSTCASFTKIMQEAKKATFIGLGGLWNVPMDVASFAGGFVCRPELLNNLAKLMNSSFPQFVTSATWQFDWAVWYSKLEPTRPVQFTFLASDHRLPFWDFPHPSINSTETTKSISSLYDVVIEMMWNATRTDGSGSSGVNKKPYIAGLVVLSVGLVASLAYIFISRRKNKNELRSTLM